MKKEIVVNVGEHEIRIALVEDDKLVELHVERPENERMVGDMYKGKVTGIVSGMQAAFVEIGMEKAAFLHVSDIGLSSDTGARYDIDAEEDEVNADVLRKHRYENIESILSNGQEIAVQIIKEPIGTKGPRVTTDLSLPGRYSVLSPNSNYIRVSKKITNFAERRRLRRLVYDVKPEGVGIIVRTEGEGRTEKEFKNDIRRLGKIWSKVKRKTEKASPGTLLHKEESMTSSVIRDVFTTDVDRLIVDDKSTFRNIIKYVRTIDPAMKNRIELYSSDIPVFDTYGIESEIDKMLDRKIWVKKGAYIVIDQTEALVTIDVNSGRFVGRSDPENMILQTNLESAKEAARQIRLRDIGGLLIIDFIDMYSHQNRRILFEEFKKCFANDRAKNSILPVSDFGLIEMTRERTKPSIMYTLSDSCPVCHGFGRIMSKETVAMKVERWFMRAKVAKVGKKFEVRFHPEMAKFMRNDDVNRIREIEKAHRFKIDMTVDESLTPEDYKIINTEEDVDVTALYQSAK